MNTLLSDHIVEDARWKDLYKIAGITSFVMAGAVLFAIIAFFIWPYKPGYTSAENIFATLQNDRLGGMISLDLPMLIITLISPLPLLALYIALKRVNESYALIALFLGAIAVLAVIPARPIAEMVFLSSQYASATTEAARNQSLSAGEAFIASFSGTAWLVNVVFSTVSSLISSLLMLRSTAFGKITAYVGIVSNIAALGFVIPVIGIPLLFLSTIGGVVLQFLIGRGLLQLARVSSVEVIPSPVHAGR